MARNINRGRTTAGTNTGSFAPTEHDEADLDLTVDQHALDAFAAIRRPVATIEPEPEPEPVDAWEQRRDEIVERGMKVRQLLSERFGAKEAELEVVAIGEIVGQEILDRCPPIPERATEEEIDRLKEDLAHWDKLYEARWEKNDASRRKRMAARALLDQFDGDESEIVPRRREAAEALNEALGDPAENRAWLAAHAEATREVLSEIRPLGPPDGTCSFHPSSPKKARDAFNEAAKNLPMVWLQRSEEHDSPLSVRSTKARAHYAPSKRISNPKLPRSTQKFLTRGVDRRRAEEYMNEAATGKFGLWNHRGLRERKVVDSELVDHGDGTFDVNITLDDGPGYERGSIATTDGSSSTTIHEFMHRMEHANPNLGRLEHAFLARRCADENGDPKPLQRIPHHGREMHRDGGFVHEYVGKVYEDSSYHEVLSVGSEAVYGGGYGGLLGVGSSKSDPDHRNFVLGCLAAI